MNRSSLFPLKPTHSVRHFSVIKTMSLNMKFLALKVCPDSPIIYKPTKGGLVKLTSVALALNGLKSDSKLEHRVSLVLCIGDEVKDHVIAVLDTRLHPFASLDLILPSGNAIQLRVKGNASVCVSGYESAESAKRSLTDDVVEPELKKSRAEPVQDEDSMEDEEDSEFEAETSSSEELSPEESPSDEEDSEGDVVEGEEEEGEREEETKKTLKPVQSGAFSCAPCKRVFKFADALSQHNSAKHA